MSWYVVVLGGFWLWMVAPRVSTWVMWRIAPNQAARIAEVNRRIEEAWRNG